MKKEAIVTGLDIGSSRISAVAALIGSGGALDVLAQSSQGSRGISRGAVVSLSEAVKSVSGVMNKICAKIPRKPGDIYVNISGESIKGGVSRGMIPLSSRGREITGPDMARCVNAAGTIRLSFDREIVHKIVQRFSVDDEPPIKNPLGLYASRLACEAYIITANANHIQNIYKCVNNAGYDIKEIVFTGIADGSSLLTGEEREEGALLLDMGASLTEASVFADGTLADLEVILIGGEDIKGGFKDSPEFSDIIARVKSKLENLSASGKKIRAITITGGISFNDGIVEFLEEKLAYPVRMGVAKEVRGEVSGLDSVRLSTAIGLARYAREKCFKKTREEENLIGRLSAAVTDIFNNYF
ncbi:MAG: cell division protein FtsA [Candidatus Omnitrophota bacterium]